MLIVDSLIISGVKFVLTRIAETVQAEMYDESALREELLAAQMKLELGEITDDEFAQIEEQVIAAMREVRERKKADAATNTTTEGASTTTTTTRAPGEGQKFTIDSVDANLDRNEEVSD